MRFLLIALNFCQLSLSATVGLTGSSIILWYLDSKGLLLTQRHVGIFLILFLWMEKNTDFSKISHTWKARGALHENSLCTVGSFGMLLIASAPLNRSYNQEIRTVCEQECTLNCGYSTGAIRISDSICPSHRNNKYFTIWVCIYYVRI